MNKFTKFFILLFVLPISISGCFNPIEKVLGNHTEIKHLLDKAKHYRYKEKDFIKTEEYEKKALNKMRESRLYKIRDYIQHDGGLIITQKINLVSAMLLNDRSTEAYDLLISIKISDKLKEKDAYLYSTYLYYLGWSQHDLKQYEEEEFNLQQSIKFLEKSGEASQELVNFVKRGYEELKKEKNN